jgi:nicotinate-nucleotide adenylyltransferase
MLKPTNELILSYLKAHVSPARYKHTLGTCRVALVLAERYAVPKETACLAALLHDAGKSMPSEAMVRYTNEHRLRLPLKNDVIKYNPSLLHSYISAHIARTVFGITDHELLDAICQHTVGSARMSTLAKIIYLADTTSLDRRRPGIKALRRTAARDLDRAMQLAIAEKILYVLRKNKWMHPLSVEAWNYYIDAGRLRDNA